MKKRSSLLFPAAVCIGILLVAARLFAAGTVPDIIPLDSPAYQKHIKPIVEFSHKKHITEYAKENPDLYKNGCGECHHDKDGKPLSSLKEGDAIQLCIECHKIPDLPKAGKSNPKLTDKEKLAYQGHALHENCTNCHKAFARATKKRTAPTTCIKCHLKEK